MMLVVESCIVADPPEYRTPVRTRPVLNVYSAAPTTTKVLVVDNMIGPTRNVPIRFNVPIQSEDAGEDLRALFFLDYGTSSQDELLGKTIAASTYDNTGRAATLTWTPNRVSDGCHFVTLVVAHVSTFLADDDDRLDPSKADADASLLTWTVNMNPPADSQDTLPNCPSGVVPGAVQ
jgi:hypothetical protein